jgi:inosose dehydratase
MNTRLPQVRIGINPIIWSNDGFRDLGGDIPLERCLEEMHQAGYVGTELGHKYPRQTNQLQPLLQQFDLQLVSGWHSLELLEKPLDVEQQRLEQHLDFLHSMGSNIAIVAECSRRTYSTPGVALQFDGREGLLSDAEWQRLCMGIEALAQGAAARGMRLVYHHHMGTVVQNRAEIDRLMESTQTLQLLVDTGHLAFAGVDPALVVGDYAERIGHVHLKDVRQEVVQATRATHASFETAVRNGVFTVPGDGGIDFTPVFANLEAMQYKGWLVVEAEQNPDLAPPLLYAARGREYLRRTLGV